MRDFTEIVMVLDRSSSMEKIRGATIESFNQFTKDQAEIGDNASLSLYTFATEVTRTFMDKPINKVDKLTLETYKPDGYTAMNDAIGLAIDDLGEKLAKMDEKDRPNKVVVVILTDGEENMSKRFNISQIREKIKHQETKYNWQFLFLGANIDAVSVGANYGLISAKCLNFTADAAGSSGAMISNTKALREYRTGKLSACNYSQEDQDASNKIMVANK